MKNKAKLAEYIYNSIEPFEKEELTLNLIHGFLSGFEEFERIHLNDGVEKKDEGGSQWNKT